MIRLLSVDPSTTCTGWAIMESETGLGVPRIIAARALKMKSTAYKATGRDGRVDFMLEGMRQAVAIALAEGITLSVIETEGRRPARKQAPANLAAYGRAIGLCEALLTGPGCPPMERIGSELWTGKESKEDRARNLTMAGLYKPGPDGYETGDSGYDKSDAIAMGWWRIRRYTP